MTSTCKPKIPSGLAKSFATGRAGRQLGSTFLASFPVVAHAQTPTAQQQTQPAAGVVAQPTPLKSSGGQLEQVVVTAQRRSEKLEKTPVTVTALTAATLRKQAVTTETDLQTATSGLLVREGTTSNQLNYSIRGQSIDVFNNPLFGKNHTGGAILITSVKPSDQFGGYVTQRAGDYGYNETLGALNVPVVSDKVLLRVSGDYEHYSGYVRNVFNYPHCGGGVASGPALGVNAVQLGMPRMFFIEETYNL